MTRHSRSNYYFTTPTKEQKVTPTAHIAKPAVASKTGRFALPCGLHRAPGSGAPARDLAAVPFVARSLIALCVLASSFALSAAAQAEPPKLVSYGHFSAHEDKADGVAVEGSGDLFVSGFFNLNTGALESVVKLGPSGNLLSPPSPFGSGYYSGVAVNPTNGDVYVLGEAEFFKPAMIFVYDPNTGAPVSSFEVPASRNLEGAVTNVQIAADSAGNVYVPDTPANEVLEYSSSGTLLKTFTGSGAGALKEPTAVTIDSSGDLWVAGDNRIVELDSGGAPVEVNGKPVEVESEGVFSVALDAHRDVFAVLNSTDRCDEKVSLCVHLVEYSSEGRQLADVGAGDFGEVGNEGGEAGRFYSMVAVNQASGRVYVTDGLKDTVWVFGPPTAPVVDRELTAEVGASEAKLGALVSPGGIQTSYRFEYGPTSGYGSSTPFPEGSVGEGVESRAVWASANGLAPGTTYHYRVVASNELAPGGIAGEDQTFTTLTAEQAACPNEQMRGGFSGKLPDCRAYELVTPPVTSSSQFDAGKAGEAATSGAAADGEALTLHTAEPRPGAPTAGENYVARRGAGGWIAEDIMPLESYDGVTCPENNNVFAFSEQFTKDVINSPACGGQEVVSGEPAGRNLLVRENATGTYQLVNVTPPGVTPGGANFQAASADVSHVIFTETSPLAAGATDDGVENQNLYEWDEGAVRLVTVLPDGTPTEGSLAQASNGSQAISADGSHVLFTDGGALYDRIDGQRTVQIDESQGPGTSGGGLFQATSANGQEVFFLDESQLTAGSTAEAGEPDLYECALPEGASKCELANLTVAAVGKHADVGRFMPLGGHDSSYVYFAAEGVLASNTREFTNSEGNTVVEGAQAGKQNLYLWNGEKTTFVTAGVTVTDAGSVGGRTSPDGKWLAFESDKSLTGYDNGSARELFLYSAGSGSHPPTLACASCNPTGEPPIQGGGTGNGENWGRQILTDAGRAFFETTEALVPSDTNGVLDVYEYEDGHVYLISSGTSSYESNLEDASENGDDVFFRSNQQLVPQDNQPGQIVIYDARVAGGFAEPSSPPPCTTADACRTPVSPQPSVYGAPASQTFSGLGNLTPPPPPPGKTTVKKVTKCKTGFTKNKKGKCVRKKTKKSKKSKKAKKAGNDRRAK